VSLRPRAITATVVLSVVLATSLVLASTTALVLMAALLIFGVACLAPQSGASSRILWWMNPSWALLLAVIPGLILCMFLPENIFIERWGTPKYVTVGHVMLMAALAITFVVGAQLVSKAISSRPSENFFTNLSEDTQTRLERATRFLFWLTVAGYALWATIGVARGLRAPDVSNIFTGGGVHQAKNFLAPVAGVTTMTQFGPLAVVCLILLRHVGSELLTGRYLVALLALATVRNFVYAERVAILELAIPAIVLFLALPRPRMKRRAILTVLPLWAPIALLIFFGSFEYFRSYSTPYGRDQNAGRSYADYTVSRVGAYYATAPNNGVLVQRSDQRKNHVPYYVLSAAWTFPLIGGTVPHERLAGTNVGRDYETALEADANPEYNNTAALLLPVFDLGVTGAFAFWLLIGAAVGVVYRRFKAADIRGLLLYPVLFIGVVESGLILYWPTGRAIPSIVAGVVLAGVLYRVKEKTMAAESSREGLDKRRQESSAGSPVELMGVGNSRIIS